MPASTTSPVVPPAFRSFAFQDWEDISMWLARRMRSHGIPMTVRLAILADLHAIEVQQHEVAV